MSTIKGSCPTTGYPMQIGFVAMRLSMPPNGETPGFAGELTK